MALQKKKDIPSKALIADVVLATGAGAKAEAVAARVAIAASFIMVISCWGRRVIECVFFWILLQLSPNLSPIRIKSEGELPPIHSAAVISDLRRHLEQPLGLDTT